MLKLIVYKKSSSRNKSCITMNINCDNIKQTIQITTSIQVHITNSRLRTRSTRRTQPFKHDMLLLQAKY